MSLSHLRVLQVLLLFKLRATRANLYVDSNSGALIASFRMKPILIDKVSEAQYLDHSLNKLREEIHNGSQLELTIRGD